jgi:hypothetical protein
MGQNDACPHIAATIEYGSNAFIFAFFDASPPMNCLCFSIGVFSVQTWQNERDHGRELSNAATI